MASILVIAGPSEGRFYPLARRPIVVGRDEAVDLQILDDTVSRKHLQIKFDKDAGRYIAIDMKSANGVFINGSRLSADTPLVNDDVIQIGSSHLLFTLEDFSDPESAMNHIKKAGQRQKSTLVRKS
jgi:pSer/pThr/pTyr-binding forkhead associated (FHA) protein